VLAHTGADALMIGRAAQGRPWIFREIAHFLATGSLLAPPLVAEVRRLLLEHLQDHYALYGEFTGVRARASTSAGTCGPARGEAFRSRMNTWTTAPPDGAVADYFDALGERMERLPAQPGAPGWRGRRTLEKTAA
jgi:tRNA-dihydrouridine synthase B